MRFGGESHDRVAIENRQKSMVMLYSGVEDGWWKCQVYRQVAKEGRRSGAWVLGRMGQTGRNGMNWVRTFRRQEGAISVQYLQGRC